MVITDLKRTCPRCKGSGHQPGFVAMGISQINYDGRCPACKGRGFELTELGQDLVALLRPFMQDLIAGEAADRVPPPRVQVDSRMGRAAARTARQDAAQRGERASGASADPGGSGGSGGSGDPGGPQGVAATPEEPPT